MGYTANTVESEFTVPADNAAAALAAFNASLTDAAPGQPPPDGGYASLAEAADEYAGFNDSDNPGDIVNYAGFRLGFHHDNWCEERVVAFLKEIAPFADEGSYVRLQGEDDCLWGFRVVDGRLKEESGSFTWALTEGYV